LPPKNTLTHGRFVGFDGIRAIAILVVITWHTAAHTGFPPNAMGLARFFIMSGWMGVDLFFALSGFLITTLILREEDRHREQHGQARFSLLHFYVRRALRILPAFYCVFLLSLFVLSTIPFFRSAIIHTARDGGTGLGFIPYGTFWGNYFLAYGSRITGQLVSAPGSAFTVYWSLCVEEHFYLLWPLFLTMVKTTRWRLLVSFGFCLIAPLIRLTVCLFGWEIPPANVYYLSHYRMDEILWGAGTAILLRHFTPGPWIRRIGLGVVTLVVILLIVTQHLTIIPSPTTLGKSLGWTLLALGASLLITEVILAPATFLTRFLELRLLKSIGKVSYGMYLLHFQAIDLGRRLILALDFKPSLLNFTGVVVFMASLTFLFAWLLHQLVERPFLWMKERYVSDKPQPRNLPSG
jgi:peptidoglycan/LPS O-acetylase OafA/YrhL